MQGNLFPSQLSGFPVLMYYKFINKKQYRVDETADKMRIAPDTLYRYIRGENIMPADRIIDLIRATGDVEFLEFFCEPCGYVPVPIVKGKPAGATIAKDQIMLSILNGDALRAIEDAIDDGKIDKLEARRIEKAITRLQAKAAELKEKVLGEVR